MSFDNPSSFAHWQSSLSQSSEQREQSSKSRTTASPWGQSATPASNRRVLAPLATSNLRDTSSSETRRYPHPSETDSHHSASSPSAANFPPLLPSSSSRFGSRRPTPPTSSQTNSPITILQPGGNQFSSRSITSPRSRTITPSQQATGSAGGFQYSGPGAGGGGGFGRSEAYSPALSGPKSPTGFNFERSSSISSNPSSASGFQSSSAKISATQVLLLVDTITEKKGRVEWESKADKIRKVSRFHLSVASR